MAIYHFHGDFVKRSAGRSSVVAAAYRAGEKIRDERTGITHNYTRKMDVIHTEIILPEDAPPEYADRATLWNAVEKSLKRKDAQLARTLDIALPVEFNLQEQIEIMRSYVHENFVDKGMCADLAIHDNGEGNPHAHVSLTKNNVSEKGFGRKNDSWDEKPLYLEWRKNWADICNERLRQKGIKEQIDHRTLEEQGIDREPTIHLGHAAHAMTKKGQKSDRADELREIRAQNAVQSPEKIAQRLRKLRKDYKVIDDEIIEAQRHSAENRRSAEKLEVLAEGIERDSENIREDTTKLKKLQVQRDSMGFFERKKEIDEQIEWFARSKERAEANFIQKYGVNMENSSSKLEELRREVEHFRHRQRVFDGEIAYFKPTLDAIELEYKTQSLLVQTRTDYDGISRQIQALTAEETRNESPPEYFKHIKRNQQLDKITDADFTKILKNITEDQAKILLERREKEAKIKERIRRRER